MHESNFFRGREADTRGYHLRPVSKSETYWLLLLPLTLEACPVRGVSRCPKRSLRTVPNFVGTLGAELTLPKTIVPAVLARDHYSSFLRSSLWSAS